MFQSIFTFGQSVVRRILPFGTLDEGENEIVDPTVISVGEFLDIYQKVAFGNGSESDYQDLISTLQGASEEWFRILVAKEGLITVLNAPSKEAQKILNGLVFQNPKFLDAIIANPSSSTAQFANGFRESPIIRRHVYLLLVALGMHSYDGYVMIYKTVNLLQRERPNGMFQYISEEIADVLHPEGKSDSGSTNLEALVPPLALMVVLFAGGNGFFIENHLRQQIQSSRLLTSMVDIAKTKFVEEKHNRRLELPTLKEPGTRECTPQINRAIEILEQAERSRCDKILTWLEKFANLDESAISTPSDNEYMLTLGGSPSPALPDRQRGYHAQMSSTSVAVDRLGPLSESVDLIDNEKPVEVLERQVSIPSEAAAPKQRPVAEVHPVSINGMPPPAPPPPPVEGAPGVAKSLMKPLRWTKLDTSPDVVMRTIWEPRRDVPGVNEDKLEELFKNEARTGKYSPPREGSISEDVTATDLISSQTELRINVILKQFPDWSVEEIAQRIERCDVSDFDESQLKEFIAALPSIREFQEIDKLKQNGGDTGHLKPAEKFLFSLLDVDHLRLRLEVMLFVVEFPIEERSIRRNCEDIISACRTIQTSENFQRLLQFILKIGNKMNEGRPIGNAVAYETSILTKLNDMPSARPGYTLLSFLVDEMREHDPEILKFMDELQPALDIARIPLSQLKHELLASREKYAQLVEEIQDTDPKVHAELERLLRGIRGRLNSLTNIVVAAQQRVRNLAMFIMEDPGLFAIHEYLETLGIFIQSVKTVLAAPARKSAERDHVPVKDFAFTSPIMKDPKMNSVFQSLRNELHQNLPAATE